MQRDGNGAFVSQFCIIRIRIGNDFWGKWTEFQQKTRLRVCSDGERKRGLLMKPPRPRIPQRFEYGRLHLRYHVSAHGRSTTSKAHVDRC